MSVANYARMPGPGDCEPPDDELTEDQIWRNDIRELEDLSARIYAAADPRSLGAILDAETDTVIKQAIADLEAIRGRILARIEEI